MRFTALLLFLIAGLLPGRANSQSIFDQKTDDVVLEELYKSYSFSDSRVSSFKQLNLLLSKQDSIRQVATQRGLFLYLSTVAHLYKNGQRIDEAVRYGNEALSVAERLNAQPLIFEAASLLVGLFDSQQMSDQVDYYLSVANAAAEASRDRKYRYLITLTEARILFARAEYPKVIDLLKGYKLMSVNDRIDSLFRAELLLYDGLADSEMDANKSDLVQLQDAIYFLEGQRGTQADMLRSKIYGSLGIFYLSKQAYGKAVNYFQDLLIWAQANKYADEQIYVNYHLGRTFWYQEKHAKAEDFFKRSLALADSFQNTNWQIKNLEELYVLTYRDARPYEAIHYLERNKRMSDSLRTVAANQQYVEVQALYDLSRKEQQIKLLKESNHRQSVMQYSLVAGILLMTVILVLIVRLNMQQRKTNSLLERKNDEIAQQKKKLEELNETKNRLFSIIGHDLRGPVGNIRTFLEMLETAKDDYSSKEYHDIIETAKRSAASTYTLLNTLLDWAAHQLGEVTIQMEPLNPLEIVQEAELFLMGVSRMKKVRITKQIDSDLEILADRNIVMTVVRNLLANAIKYTSESGRIHVTAQKKDEKCVLTISDTGMGIPAEIKTKLFKEKVASRAGTGNEAGSGLGLFVCKSLVDELGGRIWLESEVNIGTTVYVELACA